MDSPGLLAMIFLFGLFVGFIGGAGWVTASYRAEAVEHGCAAYDPQTGKWGWK